MPNHRQLLWYEEAFASLGGHPDQPIEINGWELQRKPLGAGSFGATFKSRRQLQFSTSVWQTAAVKVLNPTMIPAEALSSSFAREVQALTSVKSRFVSRLLDAGIEGKLAWIATEFIDGSDLEAKLQVSKKLAIQEWSTLAEHCLRGLAASHDMDLMHLDIKPANIMFSRADESFAIVDFGLSKAQRLYAIRNKSIVGTLFYAAPEILEGENYKSSDVFSLGTTFYQAWSGKNPWLEIASSMEFPDGFPWDLKYRLALGLEPSWEGFPSKIREIVEPMLSTQAAKRPSPRLTLDLVRALQVPTTSSSLTITLERNPSRGDEFFAAWKALENRITSRIEAVGLVDFKLDINSAEHPEICFRVSGSGGDLTATCTVPKSPGTLVAMGWLPSVNSLRLSKKLPSTAKPEDLGREIAHALESGYGLDITKIQLA